MVCQLPRVKLLGQIPPAFLQPDKLMADAGFHCVNCGLRLEMTSALVGGVMECPGCLRVVPVPALFTRPREDAGCLPALPPGILALEIKILCGHCDRKLRLDAQLEGRMVTCPVCHAEIRVPEWSRAPVSAAPRNVAALSAAEIEFLSATVA